MLELPSSCRVDKFIPKKTFYEKVNISNTLKQEFIDKLEKITWKYKIDENTINISKTVDVEEIEVFELILKEKYDAKNLIRTITKEIPYQILFILKYNNEFRYAIKFKEDIILKNWNEDIKINLLGYNLKNIYEYIIKQVANLNENDKNIEMQLEKKNKIDEIKKQIEKLYSRMQKEKQFNIKVEINKKITELKKELDNLNE